MQYRHSLTCAIAAFRKGQAQVEFRVSMNSVYLQIVKYMCIKCSATEIQTSKHWNLIGPAELPPPPNHHHPAYVVTQQYSPSNFVSMYVLFRKENIDTRFNALIFRFIFF